MLKIRDFDEDLMCCGKRFELLPSGGPEPVWTLGCRNCQRWTREEDKGTDEPVFIIPHLIEIGGN